MDFVFYDLETTGLSAAFDQPLQFAAIRTDGGLAEIERVDLRCRLAPHILPSPGALAVTGTAPGRLDDASLPSLFEFAQQIAELTRRWAPAVWTGFNTIGFDENFLRQMFYQNLLPEVYATQFHGNTRFDILPAAYAAHAVAPGLLTLPADEVGRTTFRLDRLAPANGFEGHDAHDALGDVEATLHVARRIAAGDPELWAAMLANAHKTGVQERLEGFRPLRLVVRVKGGEPRAVAGCFCGYTDNRRTRAAFMDLEAGDPAGLLDAGEAELSAAAEGAGRVFHAVQTNKAPMLLDIAEPGQALLDRAAAVEGAPEFRRRVAGAMTPRYSLDADAGADPGADPGADKGAGSGEGAVEKRIFEGFYSRDDKRLLEEFQGAGWPRRQEIVEALGDARLRELGRRLVALYAQELLDPAEAAGFRDGLRRKWMPPAGAETEWTTLNDARAKIGELRGHGTADAALLDAIAGFIETRAAGLEG